MDKVWFSEQGILEGNVGKAVDHQTTSAHAQQPYSKGRQSETGLWSGAVTGQLQLYRGSTSSETAAMAAVAVAASHDLMCHAQTVRAACLGLLMGYCGCSGACRHCRRHSYESRLLMAAVVQLNPVELNRGVACHVYVGQGLTV